MAPQLVKEYAQIRNALDDKATPSADNPFIGIPPATLEVKKDQARSALNNGAERLRKAMAVYHHIHELIYEFGDVIQIKFDTELIKKDGQKTGEVRLVSGRIKIVDADNTENVRGFDAAAFLRLDVNKAKKDGGTFIAVLGSGKLKRATGQRHTAEELDKFNAASFETQTAFMAHFMETPDKVATLEKKLKDDNNSAFLLSFGSSVLAQARLLKTSDGKWTALGLKYKELLEATREDTNA
jgi:hypothetical protein